MMRADITKILKDKSVKRVLKKDDNLLSIAKLVANDPDTPKEALDKLADMDESIIQLLVAKHDNVGLKTLQKLARSWHMPVRGAVAKSLKIDSETLDSLVENVTKHFYFKDRKLCLAVAYNPNVSPKTLRKIFQFDDVVTKKAVLMSPNVSEDIITEAITDKEHKVQFVKWIYENKDINKKIKFMVRMQTGIVPSKKQKEKYVPF